jgi:hypothetical protein
VKNEYYTSILKCPQFTGDEYTVRKASKRALKFREFSLENIASRNYKWLCC